MKAAEPAMLRHSRAIRVVVLVNFFLVALYVIPVTNRLVDRGLRVLETVNAAGVVGWSLQLWVVGSTLLATGLLVWRFVKKSKEAAAPEGATKGLVLDAVFLFAWWVTLLAICAYGFMLGMAG